MVSFLFPFFSSFLMNHRIYLNLETNDLLELKGSIDYKLHNLRFGYESKNHSMLTGAQSLRLNHKTMKQNSVVCQELRPRSCEVLINDKLSHNERVRALYPLPCVTDGTCPFIRFRCKKGHEWKASPGSPVCLHCPICKTNRKVSGIKRDRKQELFKRLNDYLCERNGQLVSPVTGLVTRDVVTIKCQKGHVWDSRLSNLLGRKSWCPLCKFEKSKISEEELHATARVFGGEYMGSINPLVDMSYRFEKRFNVEKISRTGRLAYMWKCRQGHIFERHYNNIRRKTNGRRKCSWCPQCSKSGEVFLWKPALDLAEEV